MLEFKPEPKYENLLTLRKDDPARYRLLSQGERNAAEEYEELKKEQTRTKRPLRRRLMTAEEKSSFIRDHGSDAYLSLPW